MNRVTDPAGDEYTFPAGLPGCPGCRRFRLLKTASCAPLTWLVSLDNEDVAFAAVDVSCVLDGYRPRLTREDLTDLGCRDDSGLLRLVLLSVPADSGDICANLRAPLLLNPVSRIGRQAILAGQTYPARHPLTVREV